MSWKDELLEEAVKREEEKKRVNAQLDENNDKVYGVWEQLVEEFKTLDTRIGLKLTDTTNVNRERVRSLYVDKTERIDFSSSREYSIKRVSYNRRSVIPTPCYHDSVFFCIQWVAELDAVCMLGISDDNPDGVSWVSKLYKGRILQDGDAELILRNFMLQLDPFQDLEADIVKSNYLWIRKEDLEREKLEKDNKSREKIFTIFGR